MGQKVIGFARVVRDRAFAALTFRKRYVTVEGVRLGLANASPRMRYVMWRGYESADATLAGSLLTPEDRVIEAGAATGFMGIYCMRTLGIEHYAMIEASPAALPAIKSNFALNGVPMPELIHAAVSGDDGPTAFHVHPDFWSSSPINRTGSHSIRVSGLSLPTILAGLPWKPTALIMDIEGGEADIPLSHFALFEKLLIEIHPRLITDQRAAALQAGLASVGFQEVCRSGGSYAFRRLRGSGG